MSKANRRPLAVLLLGRVRRVGSFIFKAKSIVADIVANVIYFATPVPTPANVNTHISALEVAETTAQSRVVGAAAARDLKYDIVLNDVHALQAYVQGVADASANEATAIAIIQAAGFSVRVNGVRIKAPLAIKNGPVSGGLILTAKAAGPRSSYNWQQSSDGGVTWVDLPQTIQAKTTVTGLTVGDKMLYRFRSITKNGASDWSDPVSGIVL